MDLVDLERAGSPVEAFTVIVAALCRIFANRGIRVAPFKAQNMARNSTETADGLEVGRSTALQALAAHDRWAQWVESHLDFNHLEKILNQF